MSLTLTAEEVDVLPSAQSLDSEFSSLALALASLRETAETLTVTDASDLTGMKRARETRIALKDMRCGIEAKRKELKEESLRRGKRIDEAAKRLTSVIEPLESRMLEQETFAQRMEQERKVRLATERATELARLQFSSLGVADLGSMSEKDYATLRDDAKALYDQRLAREAKEREDRAAVEERARQERAAAERERQAAAERLEEENKRLRAEAAEREKEREKAAVAAREVAAKEAAARAKAEADARAERQAREAAESKLREAEAAERAKKAAEERARQRAAQAPDREKLRAYAAAIVAIPIPEVPVPQLTGMVKRFVTEVAGLMGEVSDEDDY